MDVRPGCNSVWSQQVAICWLGRFAVLLPLLPPGGCCLGGQRESSQMSHKPPGGEKQQFTAYDLCMKSRFAREGNSQKQNPKNRLKITDVVGRSNN